MLMQSLEKSPGQSRGRVSKKKLLDATSKLLAKRDSLDVSIAEISRESEVNHGLVKYHFENKEGLLLAVLQRDAAEAIEELQKLLDSNRSPEEKLRLHIRGVINTYRVKPYINRLVASLQCSGMENARKLSETFVTPLQECQDQLLKQAAEAGLIRDTDAQYFYFMTIGACDFLFQSRNILKVTIGVNDIKKNFAQSYADYIVDTLLRGLSR